MASKTLVAGIIGTAVSLASPALAETLTFATWQPETSDSLHAKTLHWFQDELEKRTDGEHELNIFWGGTVAGISEIGDAVETGLADMGDLVVPYFPDQYPINNAISFFWPQPNTSGELTNLMQSYHDTYPQFGQELAKFNLKLIGLRPLGNYGIICNEPIRSVEEFEGKRVRSYGLALPAALEAVGAVPVSMSTVEIYEGLERGVVDCAPIEPNLARGWKYDEVAKYFVTVPLGASWGQYIVINQSRFDGLDPELQKTLVDLGRDYAAHFVELQTQANAETIENWQAQGDFEVIAIDDNAFLALTEANSGVQEVRQQWIDRANAAGVPADEIAVQLSFDR